MDGTIPISDFYVAAVYNFPELSNFMAVQVDYSSCYLNFQVAPSVFNMLPYTGGQKFELDFLLVCPVFDDVKQNFLEQLFKYHKQEDNVAKLFKMDDQLSFEHLI